MTAWDMVSIAIVDLTGGFVAGLFFPVWLAKHDVFLFLLKAGIGFLLVLWLLMTAFGDGSYGWDEAREAIVDYLGGDE